MRSCGGNCRRRISSYKRQTCVLIHLGIGRTSAVRVASCYRPQSNVYLGNRYIAVQRRGIVVTDDDKLLPNDSPVPALEFPLPRSINDEADTSLVTEPLTLVITTGSGKSVGNAAALTLPATVAKLAFPLSKKNT